jgi:hypothetical protein
MKQLLPVLHLNFESPGECFRRAGLAESGVEYDPSATVSVLRRSMERFGERLPAAAPPPRTPDPIIVVGLPLSGTNFVERLRASLGGTQGGGETEAREYFAPDGSLLEMLERAPQ